MTTNLRAFPPKPVIDVRIPISFTPTFIHRARFITNSLRRHYDCRFTFYVTGPMDGASDLYKSLFAPDIIIHPITPEVSELWSKTNNKYAAGICERFRPPFHADHVLLLDADVICCRKFDELFNSHPDAIQSVMAHVAPFQGNSSHAWDELFDGFNVDPLPSVFHLSGYPFMTPTKFSPPYFNTGVVFAPTSVMETIADSFFRALEYLRQTMNTYFVDQIALTLALAAHPDVPIHTLNVEYNFPNDPLFDQNYPVEMGKVKFLHFLRQGIVDREKDFEDEAGIGRLVGRKDLQGSNEVFRKIVAGLM